MAAQSDPRRLRWSVPRVDVSTNQWLDMQNDISRSLQLLIRESIQRDGYIDVVNRPVEQLPRRGRPPVGVDDGGRPGFVPDDEDEPEQSPASTDDQESTAAAPTDEETAPEGAAAPVQRTEPAAATKDSPSGLDAFLTH